MTDVLYGEKVYIRPITENDTEDVLTWRNSDFVVNNFIYREAISREQHVEWLNSKVFKGLVHQFIVCIKDTNEGVGSVYLQNFVLETNSAESGIFIAKDASGDGIGLDAYKLLLQYGFDALKLHKIRARVLAGNEASIRLHTKLGYMKEATLRDEIIVNKKYETLLYFGILKEEWINN